MPNDPEISLTGLIGNHWKLTAALICACIGLAAIATAVLPRRYESHMKFLVNNERADLVITPEKNQSYAAPAEVTETQVNSEMELLKSRDLLENIVRDAKLYKPFDSSKAAEPSRLSLAKATEKLQRNLAISAIRKTNIIEVVYGAPNPELADTVLRDLGDRYLSAHLAAHSAPGTSQFFTEQVDRYTHQLTRIRATLSGFRQQRHLFSMPQQQSAAVEQLTSLEAQLKTTDADIHEQQTRIAQNQRQLAALPERVTTQVRTIPNQYAVDHLQSTLADLRNKRIELVTKFKAQDRLVYEIDQQIYETSQALNRVQAASTTEQTTDRDALQQSFKSDLAKGQVALSALQSRRADLAIARASYLAQLGNMDESSLELQQLEQAEKEALDNYTLYSHRLDEARLAESLDQQKFSNVSMIEKPVSSPIPVSPKLSLNLAVGALLGLFLSLALAFYLESRPQHPGAASTQTAFTPSTYAQAAGD